MVLVHSCTVASCTLNRMCPVVLMVCEEGRAILRVLKYCKKYGGHRHHGGFYNTAFLGTDTGKSHALC